MCEEGLRDYVIAMLIDPTGQTFLKFGEELGKLPLDSFEGKLDAILNLRNEARNWGVLLSRGSYAKFFLSDYAANENAIPNAFCREMSRVLAKYFCEQLPTCEHSHPSGEGKDKWATVFRAYEKIMVAYGFWFLPLLDGNLQNRLCDEHLTQLRTLTQPRVKDGELNQQPASQESAIVEPDLSSDSYSIWIKEIGESIDGGL